MIKTKYKPWLRILMLGFACSFLILCSRQESIFVHLQNLSLSADSEKKSQKVVEEWLSYYLNLTIPDSIPLLIDREVRNDLATSQISAEQLVLNPQKTYKIYSYEQHYRKLFKYYMIARANHDQNLESLVLNHLASLANLLQQKTQNSYWQTLTEEIKHVSVEQALSWLKAEKAYGYCNMYHDVIQNWRAGELYGAYGLQHLNGLGDLRLKIDYFQRLQLILHYYRGVHDLSIFVAEHLINQTIKNQYGLREIGLSFQKAEAHYKKGDNKTALNEFNKIHKRIKLLEETQNKNHLDWYKRKTNIYMANTYWQAGQYDSTAAICNRLEWNKLDNGDKKLIHIQRGLIHRNLGRYESAKWEYDQALRLARKHDDKNNEITILKNLGVLYLEISEYDQALDYYYLCRDMMEQYSPNDYDLKISILNEITKALMGKKDFKNAQSYIKQASEATQNLGDMPIRKIHYLGTIASLDLKMDNDRNALENFQKAIKISDERGLYRSSLKDIMMVAECFIRLNQYDHAFNTISEAKTFAEQLEDNETIIHSLALLAKLEYIKGDLQSATALSREYIPYIERVIADMKNDIRMISFFQKSYDFLKDATYYHIQQGNYEEALAYLDYAKSRFLFEQLNHQTPHSKDPLNSILSTMPSLKNHMAANHLLINYMVYQDTLYAFVLDQKDLQLLKKPIHEEDLKNMVMTYSKNMVTTTEILSTYNHQDLLSHFQKISAQATDLYERLFGWSLLQAKLEHTDQLYIVADEFFHNIPFSTLMRDPDDHNTYLVQQMAIQMIPASYCIGSSARISGPQSLRDKKILISANPQFQQFKEIVPLVKQMFPSAEELKINTFPITKRDILNQLATGYDVLFVLGHGEADMTYPELSYIELSARSTLENRVVTLPISMGEFKRSNIPASELVMLIGCETAAGKLYRSSGVLGLQQMFLTLGFNHVLASHWKIDAAQVKDQITGLFQHMFQKSHYASCLQQMQIKTINQLETDRYYQVPHPFFWGSYCCSSLIK